VIHITPLGNGCKRSITGVVAGRWPIFGPDCWLRSYPGPACPNLDRSEAGAGLLTERGHSVSLPYPYAPGGAPYYYYNPYWVSYYWCIRRWPVPVIVLVIIIVITLVGWTPPEILQLLALLRRAG
jgi:hypothetical protein